MGAALLNAILGKDSYGSGACPPHIARKPSSRSIPEDVANQVHTFSTSQSLNDVIRLARKVDYGRSLTPAASSRTGTSGMGSDGGDTFEGGIDRASWAEEPDFVWATARIVKTSPKEGKGEILLA